MVKALSIVHPGLEEFCKKEIKEKIGCDAKIKDSVVLFDTKIKDILNFCYTSQTSIKILLLDSEVCFKCMDDLVDKICLDKIKETIKDKNIRVNVKRIGDHDFSSVELAEEILKDVDFNIDLKEPEAIIYIYIKDDKAYIGIDLLGFDNSKREYKVFNHQSSIKGTVAFSLLMFAGYSKKEILVDPFCGCSTIPIEAALYSTKRSLHFYDKDKFYFKRLFDIEINDEEKKEKASKEKIFGFDMELRHVLSSKKNAKIAGINKSITFSKLDVKLLDMKFDKESVDIIATNPPVLSRKVNSKKVSESYENLFDNAQFILKKTGNISLITKDDKEITSVAEKQGFKLDSKKEFYSGKEKLLLLKYKKI